MRKTMKTTAILAAMSVMVLGAAVSVSADAKNGWVQEGTTWYYYSNDKMYTNAWVETNGKWYFVGENGKMETKKFVYDGYVLEKDEIADIDATDDDYYYYVGADGAMVTGWNAIDVNTSTNPANGTTWYYMSEESGRIYGEEWIFSGGKWYYLTTNGRMQKRGQIELDDVEYFFADSGVMTVGWYKLSADDAKQFNGAEANDWIYADEDGELVENGWKQIDGKWYYFGEEGTKLALSDTTGLSDVSSVGGAAFIMASEEFVKTDKPYYVKANGQMVTSAWIKKDTDTWFWAKSNGEVLNNAVELVSNKYYWFEDGVMQDDSVYEYAFKGTVASGSGITSPGGIAKNQSYSYTKNGVTTTKTVKDLTTAIEYLETLGVTKATAYKLGTSSSKAQ